jgi:peptide deformylase
MVKILDRDAPVLRKKAKEVPISDIKSTKIQKILEDMKAALATQDDGVAIAAPQIGVSMRIFVVSGKVVAFTKEEDEKAHQYPDIVFINPVITKRSQKKQLMEEGCLSVRYLYGKVKRATKVEIKGYDEKGESFHRGASGLMAQVFQHETDHLDGILFTDAATEVEDIPPDVMLARSRTFRKK